MSISGIKNKIKKLMEEKSASLQMNELKDKNIIELSLMYHLYKEREQMNEDNAYTRVISNIIYDKFKNLDEFYFLLDASTDFPLITKDNKILVFTDKECASLAKKEYKKHNRQTIICTITNEEFEQFFYHMFYCNGIEGFRLNEGTCLFTLEYSKIYEQKDIMSLIKNPEFVLSLYKFVQEHNWKVTYEDKEQVYNKMLSDMLEQMKKTKFIQLINNDEKLFTKKNKKKVIPLFTDEIQKNMIAEGLPAKVIAFENLDITKTYVINPKDICFELNRDIFEMVSMRTLVNEQQK